MIRPSVEIWVAPVKLSGTWPERYFDILDEDERERARSFRLEPDRRRFMASRALLQTVLSQWSRRRPDPWRFVRVATGEWRLDSGFSPAAFSLAHSGRAVAVAVGEGCRVGVDIERLNPRAALNPVGEVFTTRERIWLETRLQPERWRETMRLWTVKRAYAKLRRLGREVDFSAFELEPGELTLRRSETGIEFPDGIAFASQKLFVEGEDYQLSLATSCADLTEIELRRVESPWMEELSLPTRAAVGGCHPVPTGG